MTGSTASGSDRDLPRRRPCGTGRATLQRRAIADAAASMAGAFTTGMLHDAVARGHPRIGLATVYRAVAAMEDGGFLERVGRERRGTLYAWCARPEHHHHLVCTSCGAVAHAECPLGERAPADTRPDGFTVTSHEITLYGLCPTCLDTPGGEG